MLTTIAYLKEQRLFEKTSYRELSVRGTAPYYITVKALTELRLTAATTSNAHVTVLSLRSHHNSGSISGPFLATAISVTPMHQFPGCGSPGVFRAHAPSPAF